MAIEGIGRIESLFPVNTYYKTTPVGVPKTDPVSQKDDFASILGAAKDLLKETNALELNAQNETTRFLIGEADNAHDAMIAGQKASIALQYTNAIRQGVIQSYQTIMQMQI